MTAGRGISHSEVSTAGDVGAARGAAVARAARCVGGGRAAVRALRAAGGAGGAGGGGVGVRGVAVRVGVAGARRDAARGGRARAGAGGRGGRAAGRGVRDGGARRPRVGRPRGDGARVGASSGWSRRRGCEADAGARWHRRARGGARVLVLGGEPFREEVVMWWNFIGRSHEDVVAAREEWEASGAGRFGQVRGYVGEVSRIPAPGLPGVRLKSRGNRRHR